jgi:tripartite ATP-independent transporter DctP family solute receptor
MNRTSPGAGRAAAVLACALAAGPAAPGAEARQLRAADTQPADYPTVQALFFLDRLLRERTGGRHSIAVFHSRQLGEEKETIEQTRVGAIDLNRTNVAPLADIVPELNVLSLPFLFDSADHLHAVLEGPVGTEILGSLERYGLVGLAYYDSGARSIYNAARPIRTIADVRGLRIRVQQSEVMIEMLRALGATPVALPFGQVGTALATRIVDGAENNWPSYVTNGHHRVARYLTLTEHTMSPEVLVMSKRAWDELSAADKTIFREAARESARFMRGIWRKWEEQARADAETSGVTLTTAFDRAPFERAMEPVYRRFMADERIRRLVARVRAERR